jgi:hypothetical protein
MKIPFFIPIFENTLTKKLNWRFDKREINNYNL